MSKEQELIFNPKEARMHFLIENIDGQEETHVDVWEGYELIERLTQYGNEDFETLFENESLPVNYARLLYVEYKHQQDGVDFSFRINGDDMSTAKVKFNTQTLEDENAKKIAMIREILDFDDEAEVSLLTDFIMNKKRG